MADYSSAPVHLAGRRLHLRDFRFDDLAAYGSWQMPGHAWQDLDGPYYPRLNKAQVEEAIKRTRRAIELQSWPRPRPRLVIAEEAGDQLIGIVSWYWIGEETNWLAVGIVLFDPDNWGHGFGYEALGLWCEYLFSAMPRIVRLDLRTWSGNQGMMKLARKLGFVEEARFRQARIVNGAYFDGLGYGILREEWQARYGEGFHGHLLGRT
jgi:putative hydrolase of HD superfamily